MSPEECRRVLGVDGRAELDGLKRAKKRLLLAYHPDHNPERREWADRQTKLVLAAFDTLAATLTAEAGRPTLREHREPGAGTSWAATVRPVERETRTTHRELHYIIVEVQGQLLGLPLGQVVQVLPLRRESLLAPTSGAHRLAMGYVLFSRMRLPLIDVGAALGYEPTSADECRHFVVMNARAGQVAVAVGQVERVVPINATAIEPASQFAARRRELLKGVFHLGNSSVAIPDLDALLC